MATINKTNNAKKNTNKSPVGTMPKDKITRYKLHGNFSAERGKFVSRNTKKVAQSIRMISTYRMFAHGVTTNVVPSQLKQVAHYFLTPMSRADSDNAKDRKGLEVAAVDNTAAIDNTSDAAE
jgi:hypothetical protein